MLISGILASLAATVKKLCVGSLGHQRADSVRHCKMNILKTGPLSEFLRRIRELSDVVSEDNSFVKKFFSRLLISMQTIWRMWWTPVPNNKLLPWDRIMEFSNGPTTIDSFIVPSSSSRKQPTSTRKDAMLKAIDSLTHQVAKVCRDRAPFRQRSQSRSSSHRRTNSSTNDSSLCWYYACFWHKAHHCIKPCSFGASRAYARLTSSI